MLIGWFQPGSTNAVWQVLFPPTCVICSQRGAMLCRDHATQLATEHSPSWVSSSCYSFSQFDGVVAELLKAIKYQSLTAVLPEFSVLLGDRPEWISDEVILVPIPTSRRRMQKRGFHQAHEIAKMIGKSWNLPVQHWLVRKGEGGSFVGMAKGERMSQQIPFTWKGASHGSILLVDDVRTTGTTLERALSSIPSGIEKKCLVIAQTPLLCKRSPSYVHLRP